MAARLRMHYSELYQARCTTMGFTSRGCFSKRRKKRRCTTVCCTIPECRKWAAPKRTVLQQGVGGTVDSESALRSAGTFLLRVRAPPPAPRRDGGPESLRSPCCGLAPHARPEAFVAHWIANSP
ncbi:hypothetical protein PoB_001515800 [Plakobranchus ocellatus]|uniref:Uncharacterized protein n=1 Tax=Plakobranchus ocellatus TaxID=259542 RepID=A0AAV3Z1J6_9GAST|nr:hypothetical protein PoB_001515800 [Plakobranchus ocellatus]